ncbi:MBL fold metallo-hydrolase [Methylorubrum populi]
MATGPRTKRPGSPVSAASAASRARAARKPTTRTTPAQAPDESAADAAFAKGWVTVRMYRDILGDCFLLRFPSEGGTIHVLVDCGILQGMPGARERANRIMANIRSVTSRLDVLVATHEHVDHLSGFAQAREIFDTIEVVELWLAWTEDPRDERANRLREGRKRAMALIERSFTALTGLVASVSRADMEDDEEQPDALAGLWGLMAFSGIGPDGLSAAPGATTADILRYLQGKAGRVRFLRPGGNTVAIAGHPDVTTYVLGPPEDDALLRRSDPTKKGREVYELKAQNLDDDLFLVAALASTGEGAWNTDELARLRMSLPFGYRYLVATDPKAAEIGARNDPDAVRAFEARYCNPDDEWRRVDVDWLGAAEQLALKLDSDTNNTSLALAFELGHGPDSRVLLFPGDAQVGNWLSWDEHVWPPGKAHGDDGAIDAAGLLARTILYKVGHHGSHNATLRERGLESMTHPDLVAMVPVQQEFANGKKNWNMPFPSLLKRLEERSGGRVIRADRSRDELVAQAGARSGKPGELIPADWELFLSNLREISDAEGPLALEYRIRAP